MQAGPARQARAPCRWRSPGRISELPAAREQFADDGRAGFPVAPAAVSNDSPAINEPDARTIGGVISDGCRGLSVEEEGPGEPGCLSEAARSGLLVAPRIDHNDQRLCTAEAGSGGGQPLIELRARSAPAVEDQ